MPKDYFQRLEEELSYIKEAHNYYRAKCETLEGKLESACNESDQLSGLLMEKDDYIKELETALAEACLMSKE